LGTQKLEEFLPKVASKGKVSITNYGRWHTIKLENIINKKLGYINNFEWMSQGTKMCILGQYVNHHHNNIFVMRFWKAFNEIH